MSLSTHDVLLRKDDSPKVDSHLQPVSLEKILGWLRLEQPMADFASFRSTISIARIAAARSRSVAHGSLRGPMRGKFRSCGCTRSVAVLRGEDVSESGTRGQRLNWMRHQGDRLDPLVESPFSTGDMKFGAGDQILCSQENPLCCWASGESLRDSF
jgi:hypothetical protein